LISERPPEKDALMTDDLLDRLTVRQLVEDWAVLRDARCGAASARCGMTTDA